MIKNGVELGPKCQDCGLLALRTQQVCYRITPECRQFGPAKFTGPIVDPLEKE